MRSLKEKKKGSRQLNKTQTLTLQIFRDCLQLLNDKKTEQKTEGIFL